MTDSEGSQFVSYLHLMFGLSCGAFIISQEHSTPVDLHTHTRENCSKFNLNCCMNSVNDFSSPEMTGSTGQNENGKSERPSLT